MNYDDKRANRLFIFTCYTALITFIIGGILGALTTYFLFK